MSVAADSRRYSRPRRSTVFLHFFSGTEKAQRPLGGHIDLAVFSAFDAWPTVLTSYRRLDGRKWRRLHRGKPLADNRMSGGLSLGPLESEAEENWGKGRGTTDRLHSARCCR